MERLMQKIRNIVNPGVLLIVSLLLFSFISPANVRLVSADPGILAWTVIDTPSSQNNVVVSPSEINALAIGSGGLTFYAVDIPERKLYKSGDGGITWQNELSTQLIAAGALMPVWNIAVAPDDVNFVVAITDNISIPLPGGPKQVYISMDGGATWSGAVNGLSLAANEFISCVDVSMTYGGTNRDIAIGTRDGTGNGRVWVLKAGTMSPAWVDQLLISDVVAVKLSPTYASDFSIIVVSSDPAGTWLQLGVHDTNANTTSWNIAGGYPVLLWDPNFAPPNVSPNNAQIITADLELPSDFSGQASRQCYVSTYTTAANVQAGVYHVDDTEPHRITPPTTGRISSIAYSGTSSEGSLLAGEVTADPTLAQVNVWRTTNPTASTPTWLKSDDRKSPTGGGNFANGSANAQVAWGPEATTAYCGTSSACLGAFTIPNGSINCASPEWPDGYLNGITHDESAFSISPYAPAYRMQLSAFDKMPDTDVGKIWNQLSLIDTEMDFLSDVAALQAPQTGESQAVVNYDILYLFSISDNATLPVRFNSVWRSISDPLGQTWERVLCVASDVPAILRVRQPAYDETDRSDVVVFANLGTDTVGYSENEGQAWQVQPFTSVTDLALFDDDTIIILNDALIYMYERPDTGWVFQRKVNTGLDSGHTIAVPLKNPMKTGGDYPIMVAVGEAGPPFGTGRIVYADLSEAVVTVNPPDINRIPPPITGDAHVIFDDHYEQNGIIYNAIHDPISGSGKIYRWVVGKNVWDELQPPNQEFYGLVQRNNVLYGAWRTPQIAAIITYNAGVDRTLYPRVNVPPPPEWDYLVAELPKTVLFDREPSSLKISSNDYNNLWAIDNRSYNFATSVGCLWGYTDIVAKLGPWTTSPPSGSYISVDPKSGRAVEVNFSWRQISYAAVYELQIAKDENFYNRVLVSENITPVDQLSPTVYFPAGGLAPASGSNIGSFGNLESGHTYYWRVRARQATTGEIARSPWSATMYFTVEAGLPTASPYPTVTLFSPTYGARNVSNSPGFSWSGLLGTTEYEFVLAKDAALQQVIVKVNVPTTSYLYDGKLDYNTTYFWQVRAIEPVVSDPSPMGTFTVVAETKPVTPEVETPAPIPTWVWWIIAVFTALVVSMIAFAMVKPSYGRPGGRGKLFEIEPATEKPKSPSVDKPKSPLVDKPKNPIAKIWDSVIMAVRRQRYLKKSSDSELKDSKAEESPDKLS
jgi:hypothetical protein